MATDKKTVNEIMIEYFEKLAMNREFSTQDMIEFFGKNYPLVKESTIRAHLTKFSTNAKSRIHYNAFSDGKCDLLYKIDATKYRRYNKEKDPSPVYKDVQPVSLVEPDDPPDMEDRVSFAYEKDLRNFLVKNLHLIEPGLRLFEEDGITGIEFDVGNRYVDILALDKSNNFVVIELKVSKAYDRVIGQLLRYIAWVEQKMASDGQTVRGVIICKEISEDLSLACSKTTQIELFEYEMYVKLNKR